jgi:hypothetical protein
MRAIYMTGASRAAPFIDQRRYDSHRSLRGADGRPLLRQNHDYITLRGYFNGPDWWVAQQTDRLCRPLNLEQALAKGLVDSSLQARLFDRIQERLNTVGYDGSLLKANDLLLALDPDNILLKDDGGLPEVRICNCELIKKRGGV